MIEEQARAFGAIGDATRLRIVRLVRDREMAGHEIASALGISPALACHHLKELVGSGLLSSRRIGQSKRYALNRALLEQHVRALLA